MKKSLAKLGQHRQQQVLRRMHRKQKKARQQVKARQQAIVRAKKPVPLLRQRAPIAIKKASPLVRVAASIAIALLPGFATKARAATHPSAPPNPAAFSSVESSQFISKWLRHPTDPAKSYNMLRFSQRLTKAGPVMTFEQLRPGEGKPLGTRVGFARGVRINGDTVAKFGFRTTAMGEKGVDWRKTDFGLILAGKSPLGAQAHYWGEKRAAAYSLTVPVGKSAISVSYMGPAFFSESRAIRIGFSEIEKTLGIDLGKLKTNLGITFPKEEKAKVDVTIIRPRKFVDIGSGYFRTLEGEDIFTGFMVIRF